MVEGMETVAPADESDQALPRGKTAIEFPYSDLARAAALVHILHTNAGSSCEDGELADWMNKSAEGGTYRGQRAAARMFGLLDISQGRLTLTALGRRIVDDGDRAARVEAFLKAPLFAALYDQYRGSTVPPRPTIERHIERLGVPPKQIKRARQVFETSAHYAGFTDTSTGRFRKPGTGPGPEYPQANEDKKGGGGGGAGDGDDPDNTDVRPKHPLMEGLFQSLPPDGSRWTLEEAADWLQAAAYNLRFAYKFQGRIRVEIESLALSAQIHELGEKGR